MTKNEFLKSLLALGGLSLVPKEWQKSYAKYYLLQCFVAGFRFYGGPALLAGMKEGDLLFMEREPANQHDEKAIALYWNRTKIGFVPASVNDMLSRLMDAEALNLHAEITHINPVAKEWENIHFAVYFLKEMLFDTAAPDKAAYLTLLETPEYFTVSSNKDSLVRIENNFTPQRVVVNVNQLDNRFMDIRKRYHANEYAAEDSYFAGKGYRIIDDEAINELMPFIKDVKEIKDDLNLVYSEMRLNL